MLSLMKEINELMWYSCGSLRASGCVTQSIIIVNGFSGMYVLRGRFLFKSSVNKVTEYSLIHFI